MSSKQQLVQDLLSAMTFSSAEVKFSETEEEVSIQIALPQEESGVIIGFRGEKIDALQYLLTLMLNHESISYKPVNLDINDYHQKRQDQLNQMAETAAGKAIESGREILLPPMSPRERRLVHMYLSQNQQVSTYSEGEGSSRRIVVRPEQQEAGE